MNHDGISVFISELRGEAFCCRLHLVDRFLGRLKRHALWQSEFGRENVAFHYGEEFALHPPGKNERHRHREDRDKDGEYDPPTVQGDFQRWTIGLINKGFESARKLTLESHDRPRLLVGIVALQHREMRGEHEFGLDQREGQRWNHDERDVGPDLAAYAAESQHWGERHHCGQHAEDHHNADFMGTPRRCEARFFASP